MEYGKINICSACGLADRGLIDLEDVHPALSGDMCRRCRGRYPDSLLKATVDPFDYALRLRTGEIIYFSEAKIHGDFVHLELSDLHDDAEKPPCLFERGVDVRLSDIVWCADAPFGS